MTAHMREDSARLEARIEDHLARTERGEVSVSRFLTPGERKRAERYLAARGAHDRSFFWGGYAQAERECLFLLPPFYLDMPDWIPAEGTDPAPVLPDGEGRAVLAVRVVGSGFRTLTHRDYLGSLLGLGLERDSFGDIALQNDSEAVVFCTKGIARFLIESLCKVASDTVKCRMYAPDASFTDGRKYKPLSDTVASPRLDCVVAALTNLSREDAQNAVRSGLVEVDFECEERTDRILTPPATVSVRGHGRFILRAFDGETRKGRLRLRADQLV